MEPRATRGDLYLYAFGNTKGPRPPRLGKDITPDEQGMVGPESSPFPSGMSVFGDPYQSELTGHIWRLPAGTILPEGLDYVADGRDVNPISPYPPTHHTIFPSIRMKSEVFLNHVIELPWVYVEKKR